TRQLERFARFGIGDRDARSQVSGTRFDHDLARQAGDLVDLLDDRDAFDQVAVLNDATELGEDGRSELVPLRYHGARSNTLAVFAAQHGTVHQAVVLTLATRVIHDHELTVAVHHHQNAVFTPNDLGMAQMDRALGACLQHVLLDFATRRRATDVERAHGQLSTGLTDGLGRDDADGFANVDTITTCEVAPVAGRTHAAPGLTRQHGANHHLFDTGVFDPADRRFVER